MTSIPVINMVKTGENIIRLRKQSGLSVKELQEIFGFTTPQAIYKWQQGLSIPSIDNLIMLAEIFQVSIEEIIVIENKCNIA